MNPTRSSSHLPQLVTTSRLRLRELTSTSVVCTISNSSSFRASLELTTTTSKSFRHFNVTFPQAHPQFVDLVPYLFAVPNTRILQAPFGTPSGCRPKSFVFPPSTLLALGPPKSLSVTVASGRFYRLSSISLFSANALSRTLTFSQLIDSNLVKPKFVLW